MGRQTRLTLVMILLQRKNHFNTTLKSHIPTLAMNEKVTELWEFPSVFVLPEALVVVILRHTHVLRIAYDVQVLALAIRCVALRCHVVWAMVDQHGDVTVQQKETEHTHTHTHGYAPFGPFDAHRRRR